MRARWGLAVLVVSVGCSSSSSPAGDPLVSGSVTGSYDGNTFTPGYGFATLDMMGNPLIGIAEAKVHCGTEKQANPPPGSGIIISLSSFAPGSYPDAFVTVYRNAGNFNALGSNGAVNLTA